MARKTRAFLEEKGIIISILKSDDPTLGDLKSEALDFDALWRRVGQDMELLCELIGLFEQESPVMVGQIESAIQHCDAQDLEKSGHKIKGSLLQFSAHTAAASALRLEELGRSGRVTGADAVLYGLKREIDQLLKALHAMVRLTADDRA